MKRFSLIILMLAVVYGVAAPAAHADLFVSNFYGDNVLRYDGVTGNFVEVFASGGGLGNPIGLAFGPDGNLYVGSFYTDNVLRYNGATGDFIDVFASGGGLDGPTRLTFGPDGHLYVCNWYGRNVLRYDGMTGDFIDAFASGGGLDSPNSLTFGPDGNLYVSSSPTDNVLRYDGTTGHFIDVFASRSGLDYPTGLSLGPDGNLYVSSASTDNVLRYDGTTGDLIDVFASGGGLDNPASLAFGPDGKLYVSSHLTDEILRYSGATGDFDKIFASGGGLDRPSSLVFFSPEAPHVQALQVFYNGRFGNVADPAKQFLAVGEASQMSLVGDDLHGNVTNCVQGITGIRVTFDTVVTFSAGASAAFSYEATPEQSSDKTFTAFTSPTSPVYVVDDSTGKTIVAITFADGEIKNRWLKTIIDASQVSASGLDLDGELPSPLTLPSGDGAAGGDAEFIIGNRFGDVDANYRCLLNDAIGVRSKAGGALVGISNAYDVDKNQRVLLNDAILTRNAVSGIALPAMP